MATLEQYKKRLQKYPDQETLTPLFEIIEDVFLRRESKGLLLHHHQTQETIQLNDYDQILYQSFQKKEQQLQEYELSPLYSENEYQRKLEIRDRASNNYFAFNSALNALDACLKTLKSKKYNNTD